jgi:transcriptional regulator with XRE-family HTH domain
VYNQHRLIFQEIILGEMWMDIARRIIQLRTLRGISTNRLAVIAGVSQSHLREIELGNKQPGIDILERICSGLELTLGDFFSDPLQEFSPELVRFVRASAKLSPKQLERLTLFIESLS